MIEGRSGGSGRGTRKELWAHQLQRSLGSLGKATNFTSDTRDAGIWASVKERIKGVPDVGLAIVWELAKAELKKRLHLDK